MAVWTIIFIGITLLPLALALPPTTYVPQSRNGISGFSKAEDGFRDSGDAIACFISSPATCLYSSNSQADVWVSQIQSTNPSPSGPTSDPYSSQRRHPRPNHTRPILKRDPDRLSLSEVSFSSSSIPDRISGDRFRGLSGGVLVQCALVPIPCIRDSRFGIRSLGSKNYCSPASGRSPIIACHAGVQLYVLAVNPSKEFFFNSWRSDPRTLSHHREL